MALSSGRGCSDKVGQWKRSEGRGLGEGLLPPHLWGSGGVTPENFFENIGANAIWCIFG